VLHPDGTWLLYFVGGWHYPAKTWANCSSTGGAVPVPPSQWAWDGSTPWPPAPPGPGLGNTTDGCGPTENAGCGIRLAHSRSPFGPWVLQDVVFSDEGAHPANTSHGLDCSRSDPAPYVLPNGTVLLAFGSGDCHGGMETIGVARTEDWRHKPFALVTGNPISELPCPCNFAEDANLWFDGKGWHIIAHGLCSWVRPSPLPSAMPALGGGGGGVTGGAGVTRRADLSWNTAAANRSAAQHRGNLTLGGQQITCGDVDLYALHAWSEDGVDWRLAMDSATGLTVNAWSKNVTWGNGSSTYMTRMERPQVILDQETGTRPIFLTTAVCPGGDSVGGAACHFTIPSWNLYRPIRQGGGGGGAARAAGA
jgi:hypothetical protein